MKTSKGINLLLVILLIVSVGLNLNTRGQVEALRNEVSSLNIRLSNDISRISGSLSNFTYEVNKEMQWVGSSDYRAVGINEDYSELEVEFTVRLNEQRHDETLFLVMTDEDGTETKIQVPESESLTCTVRAAAGPHDYTVSLLGIGEESSRSHEIERLYLRNMINDMVFMDGDRSGHTHYSSEKRAVVTFSIGVAGVPEKGIRGMEEIIEPLEFTSIMADVYIGDAKLDTLDLLKGEGFAEDDRAGTSHGYAPLAYEWEISHTYDSRMQVFGGTYLIEGDSYEKYLEAMTEDEGGFMEEMKSEIYFVVTATDTHGREFKQVVGSHFYELIDGELVFTY